jgi:hypothetical protein
MQGITIMMSIRRYLLIGLLTGIMVFGVTFLFGTNITPVLVTTRDQAVSAGMGILAQLIAEPLIWGVTNPIPGALVAGILWPALFIWLALLFIMVLVGFGAAGVQDVDSQVSLFRL